MLPLAFLRPEFALALLFVTLGPVPAEMRKHDAAGLIRN